MANVGCMSIVIRMNRAEKGLKLILIVINPDQINTREPIHHLWAKSLKNISFLNGLLVASSWKELHAVEFDHHEIRPLKAKKNTMNGNISTRPFSGIYENVARRSKHYWSDFIDGLKGDGTLRKVISTSLFLFFLTILASTAMGVLNEQNTRGKISRHLNCLNHFVRFKFEQIQTEHSLARRLVALLGLSFPASPLSSSQQQHHWHYATKVP